MAHTVPNKGPPPRPIYPTACMYSVGRLRSLHADCRPVRTTRPNWGRNSGLWGPSNGQPTWPSHPMLCPGLGSTPGEGGGRGGLALGPQGCTRCPTDAAAWFRRVVACVLPHPSCIHSSSQPQNPPLHPLQFVLVPVRANRIGPGHTYFCHLSKPPRETAAARRPGDRSFTFVTTSGTCLHAVLFSGLVFQVSFHQFPLPPESTILVH